mgnify:CR=1 FL=1
MKHYETEAWKYELQPGDGSFAQLKTNAEDEIANFVHNIRKLAKGKNIRSPKIRLMRNEKYIEDGLVMARLDCREVLGLADINIFFNIPDWLKGIDFLFNTLKKYGCGFDIETYEHTGAVRFNVDIG